MKRFILFIFFLVTNICLAQIWEPDGLRLPGDWNGWTNSTGMGGDFDCAKSSLSSTIWTTTFQSGATANQLFKVVSGGANPWGNQWYIGDFATTNTITKNTVEAYIYTTDGGAPNNQMSATNGNYYIFNWKDSGYNNTQAIFMETSSAPVTITDVSDNYSGAGNNVTVTITTSALLSAEEKLFVRYTEDSWVNSSFVQATYTGSGTDYSAIIPGADVTGNGASNNYYVFTTTVASPTHSEADLMTINYSNNSGLNFPLPVELTSFTANVFDGKVKLSWETATEVDNYGFEILRHFAPQNDSHSESVLTDEESWETIGFVAGHGNSNSPKEYSFVDDSPASSVVKYRLKQIDIDGAYEYSNEIEVTLETIPAKFELAQNYPNPFNPSTVIKFNIPETNGMQNTHVKLEVFDVLGKRVAVLVNENLSAGSYERTFNANGLSSGIYYYQLTTPEFSNVKKMILVR